MSTDRELLELAAKAAGIVGKWERRPDYIQERWYFNVPYDVQGMLSGFEWNPLTDDGDALRLAVKLKLDIELSLGEDILSVDRWDAVGEKYIANMEAKGNAPYAATRRAIVSAAAEIGASMISPAKAKDA